MHLRALAMLYAPALLLGGGGMLVYEQSLKYAAKARQFGGTGTYAKKAEDWRFVAAVAFLFGALVCLKVWKVYFAVGHQLIARAGTLASVGLFAVAIGYYIFWRKRQVLSPSPTEPKSPQ